MPEAAAAGPAARAREDLARAALGEITRPENVGDFLGEEADGLVVTLRFATTQSGYPGWAWTVAIAELLPGEPSVLEAELLPGEGALLAPDWVPWSERLEEWRAAQLAAGLDAEDVVSDDDGDDEDVDADDVDPDDVDDEPDVDYDGPDPEDLIGDEDTADGSGVAAPAADAPAVDLDGDEEDDSDAQSAERDDESSPPGRRRRRRGKGKSGDTPGE